MRIERHLDALAARVLREALGLAEDAEPLLRPTSDPRFGDYQLNGAMALAKKLGKPPRELAGPVAEALAREKEIASAEVAGPGFVNLRLDDGFISEVLTGALRDLDHDGVPPVVRPLRIVVDYSAPNIAKQMHVGHLRSTIIGAAVVRLLHFVGHDVVSDNHLGDWGTLFGLLIVGMRDFGSEEALAKDPIDELERVYKLASERAKSDETVAARAREELAKLQAGDPANRAIWQRAVDATRGTLDAIYARLGVGFDLWRGESTYHDMLPGVIELLLAKNLAREDQGALCVFFGELEGVPDELKKQKEPFIVRKKDGAYLYSTTDIATLLWRRDVLKVDRSIYVVGSTQALHFKQLFALAKLLGIDMELEHVGFGNVLDSSGKLLKTREGRSIKLAALLDEAEQRALARIREGIAEGELRISEDRLEEVARAVGIGAVKYADLQQNRLTDYKFDWDKMISFKGNAGPYLQYAHARIQSIFRKGGIDPDAIDRSGTVRLAAPAEAALGRQLVRFADNAHRAAETLQPHLLCDHLFEIARAFSTFYSECPVLDAEPATRDARLALIELTARQLRRGLRLLGIEPLDQM